ncbi:MAG: aspartate kinase [Pseudomonadota bacterium]
MALLVKKWGGTSLATPELFSRAADRVIAAKKAGHDVVVVLSAMGKETDRLQGLADEITKRPSKREMDVLLSAGERVSMALMSIVLDNRGFPAKSYTGSQVPIVTSSLHTKAQIEEIGTERLKFDLDNGIIPVVAGFQGIDRKKNITTLGRGGSDTTAVALAASLRADECDIYTDVDGVFTTDPRVVPKARLLPRLTFEEMLEMSSLGSRVLQIRSVKLAAKYNLPIRVLSSFNDGVGTLISYEEDKVEAEEVTGIAFTRDEAEVAIHGAPDQPGIAHKLLQPISDAGIEIDMIVQNSSLANGRVDFGFTVQRADFEKAMELVSQSTQDMGVKAINGDDSVVKISLVGLGMRSQSGVATKMFQALASEGINIRMVSTSEIKVSVLVDEKYLELGVRTLHEAFDLERNP